jgi:hypothetical protein
METWVDYSGGNPGGANLVAAGITGAIRYVGIGSGAKRLTAAELADLTAHGVQVRGVAESTVGRSLSGYSGGVVDAQTVLADPVTATLPFIYATNDETTWSQASVDYVRGFRDTIGLSRTGAYGFASFLAACRAQGVAASFWQAGSPPSATGTAAFVNFWQRQGSTQALPAVDGPAVPVGSTIGGVSVDFNNRLLTDVSSQSGVTDVANTNVQLTVDNAAGHAYAVVTEGGNSAYFSAGWLSLVALYGDEKPLTVHINYLGDDGSVKGGGDAVIAWNKRYAQALPDSTGIITIDWTPVTGGCHLAGAVELASR